MVAWLFSTLCFGSPARADGVIDCNRVALEADSAPTERRHRLRRWCSPCSAIRRPSTTPSMASAGRTQRYRVPGNCPASASPARAAASASASNSAGCSRPAPRGSAPYARRRSPLSPSALGGMPVLPGARRWPSNPELAPHGQCRCHDHAGRSVPTLAPGNRHRPRGALYLLPQWAFVQPFAMPSTGSALSQPPVHRIWPAASTPRPTTRPKPWA